MTKVVAPSRKDGTPELTTMSIDWVVYTDNPYLPSKETIESSPEFTRSWNYSATNLQQLLQDQDWCEVSLLADLTPLGMQALANSLATWAAQNEAKLTDDQTRITHNAKNWLLYWADLGFCITAYY